MDDCLIWEASKSKKGYGYTFVDGRVRLAHRAAYVEANGLTFYQISGKIVRHRCYNPSCVNPNHLEIGTHADNMRDRAERNRTAKGERAGLAKLTNEQIEEIRRRYKRYSRENSTYALASEFGVHQTTIARITRRATWK